MEQSKYLVLAHLCRLSPSPPPHLPSRLQVFLSFSHHATHQRFYVSTNPTEVSLIDRAEQRLVSFGFWMDFRLFSRRETAYDHLLPRLSDLQAPQCYRVTMAEKIFQDVRRCAPSMPAATLVLPYCFRVTRMSRVFYDDRVLVDTALRESRREFEMRNCGMVPTAPKSLRLKCVKVKRELEDENREEAGEVRAAKKRRVEEKEEENCTICLEELGEFAAAMPCKHMFHGQCIIKWLKTSHYCPICRFEMPSAA